MPMERVSTILKDARKNKYAVAAFNVFNVETILWVIKTAQEEKMPVIIEYYPGFTEYFPMHIIAGVAKELGSRASVPVGIHLDHSKTYEECLAGINAGFQSIMIDGSALGFEENIHVTKRVVSIAHTLGADVEAELGYVGDAGILDDITNKNNFTQPDMAVDFIARTGADSLAVSIGNAHGNYVKTPELDFERLETIEKLTGIPIVLHGGSDIPDVQVIRAVGLGICKMNIFTELTRAFYQTFKEAQKDSVIDSNCRMHRALWFCENAVRELVREKIRLLNPNQYKL